MLSHYDTLLFYSHELALLLTSIKTPYEEGFMKKNLVTLSITTALYAVSQVATANVVQEKDIERISVKGTRAPLYDTRDVNAAAFGIKDTLTLPLSIQSFSQQLIENQQVKKLADILANDSSVQNSAIGGVFDFVSLRGFQLDWSNGLRRDGLALAPYQDVALEHIQRLDVLKGPSGLVSGVNNPGGTINYVTKRPTSESFVDLTAQLRSQQGKYVHLDTGGAFESAPHAGYRINLAIEDSGDFTQGDDQKRYFASAAFDWQVTDRLLLRIDGDHQHKTVMSQPILALAIDPSDPAKTILPPYVDINDVLLGQPWTRYKTQATNIALRADYWLADEWQWINQVAYSQNNRHTVFPDIRSLNSNGDVLSGWISISPDEKYQSVAAHSLITGSVNIGNLDHDFVMGVSLRDYSSADGRWIDLDNPISNIFNPVYVPRPQLPKTPDATDTDTTEYSAFITDTLHLSEQWHTTLGLRYIKFKKQQHKPGELLETLDNTSFVTPMIGINYQPTDDVSFYASYSEGAGEGAVAVKNSGMINEGDVLGPQESEQLEFGVKVRQDGATYSAAIFQIEKMLEYHNRTTNYFVQDGQQVHRGIELNVNGELTDTLSIVTSATVIDAEISGLAGEPQLNGNQPLNVPKVQTNVFFDYQTPFSENLTTSLGIFYVGKREQNVNNTLIVPDYTRVDFGVRYKLDALNTTINFKVENVLDKEYWVSAGAKGVNWGVTPGAGRVWALSAKYTF